MLFQSLWWKFIAKERRFPCTRCNISYELSINRSSLDFIILKLFTSQYLPLNKGFTALTTQKLDNTTRAYIEQIQLMHCIRCVNKNLNLSFPYQRVHHTCTFDFFRLFFSISFVLAFFSFFGRGLVTCK